MSFLLLEQACLFTIFAAARSFVPHPDTLLAFLGITLATGLCFRIFVLVDAYRLARDPLPRWYTRFDVYLAFVLVGTVIAILVDSSITIRPFRVSGGAMAPALRAGEHVLVDTSAYAGGREPERGDVVVVSTSDDPPSFVARRMAALPGGALPPGKYLVRSDNAAVTDNTAGGERIERDDIAGKAVMILLSGDMARTGTAVR